MKKALMASTALVAAGFIAADAAAVDVELYGQVNKAFVAYDDGQVTDSAVVDNDVASTRFGFMGSQALDNGLTASVLMELELQSNPSNNLVQSNTANQSSAAASTNGANVRDRQSRVGLAGDWGAVFLGRQSTATDGTAEADLAGVKNLMNSDASEIGGDLLFTNKSVTRNAAGGDVYTGANGSLADLDSGAGQLNVTVDQGQAELNMDGQGIQDAIRYDSPIFNGFQGRVSVAQGGDVDAGVFYNGKYDAYAIKGALGYVRYNDAATAANDIVESQLSASVSVKHDSGIAGTVAYGKRSLDNKSTGVEDPDFMYLKAGYAWDAFEVAADYGNYSDYITTQTADHELKAMGLGAQYNLGNGVSVAGVYRSFGFEIDSATLDNADDISLYALNLRVKF